MKTQKLAMAAASGLVFLLSACGPQGPNPVPAAPVQTQNGFQNGMYNPYMNPGLTEFACATSQPNILPQQSNAGTAGTFTACPSSSSMGRVRLNGQTVQSDWVCAIPINITGVNQAAPARGANGAPLSQCLQIGAQMMNNQWSQQPSGLIFDFGMAQFNGLVVVEAAYLQQMLGYMNQQMMAPPFSYGRIR